MIIPQSIVVPESFKAKLPRLPSHVVLHRYLYSTVCPWPMLTRQDCDIILRDMVRSKDGFFEAWGQYAMARLTGWLWFREAADSLLSRLIKKAFGLR